VAHLDTLIDRISDPKLRSEIQDQVNKLTAKTSFGLVFEEHRPETVTLPGFEITRGGKVAFKDGSTPGIWTVLRLIDGEATIVRTGDTTERGTAHVDELVVIREFGDPIYPGLEPVGEVTRGGDKPFHTVINAENYHALQTLLYTHEGKVDAIYIDPPYNTGSRDWKYNNDYVDGDDQYRHSKWLAFMERRLKIAKRLLNPVDATLVVTIDEKEVHRLGLLLDKVFPEARRQMVTIVINPNGSARGQEMSRVEEYAFFLFFGQAGPGLVSEDLLGGEDTAPDRKDVRWERLVRGGANSRRQDRPNLFYPIFIDPETKRVVEVGDPLPIDANRNDVQPSKGLVTVWPLKTDGQEGRWRASAGYIRELLAAGHARLGAYDSKADRWSVLYLGKAQIRRIETGDIEVTGRREDGSVILQELVSTRRTPKTVWNMSRHTAGEHGSNLLKRFVGARAFPFPKSLYAVEDSLRVALGSKKDGVVLDFFAGSGTTAHAVMRLNRQDSGRRRSISITNNEVSAEEQAGLRAEGLRPGDARWEALGICEHITRPRLQAAITGRTTDGEPLKGDYRFVDPFPVADGFEENIEFFKLTYEDNQLVRLGRKFHAIAPLLWMRAGAEGTRIDDLPEDGWSLPKDSFYGVLTDIDQWEPFVNAVNARDDVRCIFIVTDSQAEFEAINVQIDQGIDSVRLYADYLQSFEINTRQG
jgi:adenine-specific DNA-methyltransferase